MAKKQTTSFEDATAPGGSLNNDKYGVGENADGTFNSFPVSELNQRVAERNATEEVEDEDTDPFLDDDSDLGLEDEDDDSDD